MVMVTTLGGGELSDIVVATVVVVDFVFDVDNDNNNDEE